MKSVLKHFRTRFLAGVLVAVPTIATFLALRFLFRQVDGIFSPWVSHVVGRHIPGLGIAATILVVFAIGFVATNFVGRRFVAWGERLVAQLPFVRTIYKASKDIVHAATMSRRQVFRDIVMIEYPRKGAYSYGFVTSYTTRHSAEGGRHMANVFVPGPPLPTTGVLIALPVEELFYLDVSMEDALKLILSGGVAAPSDLRERERKEKTERDEP
jgi:uncharacterized membrane protein